MPVSRWDSRIPGTTGDLWSTEISFLGENWMLQRVDSMALFDTEVLSRLHPPNYKSFPTWIWLPTLLSPAAGQGVPGDLQQKKTWTSMFFFLGILQHVVDHCGQKDAELDGQLVWSSTILLKFLKRTASWPPKSSLCNTLPNGEEVAILLLPQMSNLVQTSG